MAKRDQRPLKGRRMAFFLSGVLLLSFVFFRENKEVPGTVFASTTQQKINETQKEKDALKDKLDGKQDEIDALKGVHRSLKSELSNLNSRLSQISEELSDLESQIAAKEQEISDTQLALEEAIEVQTRQYEYMKQMFRYLYESNNVSYLNALVQSQSLSDLINTADFFEKVADYSQKKLEEFQENTEFITSEEQRLEEEKAQLDELKRQTKEKQDQVTGMVNQTKGEVSKYADQISDAEKQALAYEAEIRKKEEDLEYLKKKLKEELARSRAAAGAKWRDISELEFAEGDRKLLANLIYCEAGGEPYEGKVAVGAVVINRVRSSIFPDTVVGVIYQSRQFSPAGSGRLELAFTCDKATESCYRAADEAMAGASNVGNCVFFRTPVEGLNGISIGGHIFY